jgi:hypothetical protein
MRDLRHSLAIVVSIAGLGLAQAPVQAQAQPSDTGAAAPEAPRKIVRINRAEEVSGYRKAILTHYTNYAGFGAGMSSGIGLSYRHWFSDDWGVQLNILPYYSETKYPSSNSDDYPVRDSGFYHNGYFSAGLTALHEFARLDAMRFIGYVAGSVTEQYTNANYYYREYGYYYNGSYQDSIYHSHHEESSSLVAGGFGLGMEFFVWRFSFSPMVGFRGAYDLETKAKEIGPTVEGAAHFRF